MGAVLLSWQTFSCFILFFSSIWIHPCLWSGDVGSAIAMPRTSYHIDKVSGKIQSTADGVWGVALRHSGVLMPCLKWTLSIGCINTVLRPSLSPGPFIYSCDPIRPQEVGVCSRDTTLRNRLTRDKSHYKS